MAFYSGWYSLNHYNGASVFNWAPGAIGFHLDSNSALDPRLGVSWSTLALANGITVTSGSIDEPFLEGLPRPAGVFRNLLEGANVADAFMRNTRWLKWRIINIGDPLYRPFPPTGRAPFNPPAQENSFAIETRFIVGGPQTNATIRLAAAAPPGGLTFSLASSQTYGATVPATTTVPAGATSVTFPISTLVVIATAGPVITANATGVNLSNAMVVYPMLDSVVLSSSSVTGGQSLTGTVYLSDLAPAGGILVNLSSSIPGSASTPATVLVPAGTFHADFPITTYPLPGMPQIRATFAGLTVFATLTVN